MKKDTYIFTSKRLGFRTWTMEDVEEFAALNADEEVMEHFPNTLSKKEVKQTIFTPAIDIGWRLTRNAWGKGYATEGAKRCLDYAFHELDITKIISVCTIKNNKSEHVMKKIGMTKIGEFNHPDMIHHPAYEQHVCYEITNIEEVHWP